MLRIAFGRKNKIMSAEFKNKKVIESLEKNYQTHCSLQNKAIPMEFDFKNLVHEALVSCEMLEKRARQMDIGKGSNIIILFCCRKNYNTYLTS